MGDHLTRLRPLILEIKRVRYLFGGSSTPEPLLVSQQSIQPSVDEVDEPMQFSIDPTILLESVLMTPLERA
jgi:hypothetical protein